MKNRIKALLLVTLIIGVALMMPSFVEKTTMAADEAEWSQEGSDSFYGFTVVEIMPYKGMSEIGYLVGGQEPIDGSMIPYQDGAGKVSFLGGAISTYCRVIEKPMPVSGNADQDWIPGISYVAENGYFEKVSSSTPDLYRISENETIYERVANGTGTHIAKLPDNAAMDSILESWSQIENYRNVKAYFVSERPADTSLTFSQAYKAFNVTRKEDRTGDYDYDTITKKFYLNKGKGLYDVIFALNYDTSNNPPYYMLKDYEIVPEGTGDYSYKGTINYVEQAGGNYKITSGAMSFTYVGTSSNNYRWVKDDTALTKANFAREGNRIWVKGQRIRKTYQFRRFTSYVNNEYFKRYSLGVPADQVHNYPVRVLTLTPQQLNSTYQSIIDEANMFYISDSTHNGIYIENYEKYNAQGILQNPKYTNNRGALSFAYNDLNWDTTVKIFKRIAGIGCHKAAVVVDHLFYRNAVAGTGTYGNYHKNIDIGVNYNNKGGTSVNIAKLYIMITQRNMIDFYNSFLNPDVPGARLITRYPASGTNTGLSPTGDTGSFIRPFSSFNASSDASIYWNGNTFLPFAVNSDGVMSSYNSADELYAAGIYNLDLTLQTTDLANNVLILNGQDVFTDKFTQPISIPNQNPGDQHDAATEHLNGLDPTGTTTPLFVIGNIVNVITNNGTGFKNIGGAAYPEGGYVEGPPSTVPDDPGTIPEDGTEGSNQRSYKRVLNIQPTAAFTQSEANIRNMLSTFDVQIISMTSMEFNSSIEDINSKYDVVYIGSNVYSKKNSSNVTYFESSNRFNTRISGNNIVTDFNDSGLDRYVYSSKGDSTEAFIDPEYEQVRYRGNDLTMQKISELEDFLYAGYPIVLESNLYHISNDSDSTAKVDPTSNIYSFINGNKSYSNLLNYADFEGTVEAKASFLRKLKSYVNILRPVVSLEEPVIPDSSTNKYFQVDPDTDRLILKFQILPKSGVPSIYTYNAYLYLDKNGDGIFESSEDLDAKAIGDGSRLLDLRESKSVIYTCYVDMSSLNGGYQWKLVVQRASNPMIRSNISGYVSVANGKEVNILQITDSTTSSYRLSEKILDSNKLIYAYAGAGKLSDYNLNFETITVSEYESMFSATSKYDPTRPAATSRLSQYHVVIFDNPSEPITDPYYYGSIRNIKDEIANRKLGVLFTKDALGYSNQDDYFNTSGRSFMNNGSLDRAYTYNYINHSFSSSSISSGSRYIYKDMVGNNNSSDYTNALTYRTNYLTKTNDGVITNYPYKINRAIGIADNFYSKDAVIDYDLTKGERLIGWYSLSDNRSPVVREIIGLSGTADSLYKGMYSSSPNDVKNNYYLFSNGSTYYSGIRLAEADISGNDNEMKLFVNTILACHGTAGERAVSNPPEIEILDPIPQLQPDNSRKITIQPDDLVGTDFILEFRINKSSSNMDLDIIYNDMSEPDGLTWNNYVYPVDGAGALGSAIVINNTGKVIQKDTKYAIKIPISQLTGSDNKLTLNAENMEGNRDTEVVYLEFVQPPVVTILDPVPPAGVTKQYIYVDLDYSPDVTDEAYLAEEQPVRIEFKVESVLEYNLSYTSGPDSLTDGGADDVTVRILTETAPGAPVIIRTYELLVPARFITNLNGRDLKITATASGQTGEANARILRRSLFPLD